MITAAQPLHAANMVESECGYPGNLSPYLHLSNIRNVIIERFCAEEYITQGYRIFHGVSSLKKHS